jgi:WD40 repeat protein
MSASPNSRDELSRLLSAVEDDLLEPGDAARLGELLRTDPEARRRYYDYVILTSLLRREGRRAAASQEADSKAEPSPLEPRREVSIRREGPHRRAWLLALAASALLALLLSVGEVTGVTHLVPTIVRIVTGEGSLVIEVDDPTVSVTLDGEDITINGAGIHELKLRPGTHRFVATKDGRPARTELVTIQKGERTVVTVTLEPNGAPAAASESRRFLGHTDDVGCAVFTPDGRQALSSGYDACVRVWDVETGREVRRFTGHKGPVWSVAVSPDGRRALSSSGGALERPAEERECSVCLWEVESGKELRRIEAQSWAFTSVAFSPDGRRALFGCYDGTVRLWDIEQWEEIRRFNHMQGLWSVRFSPDGRLALTCGGWEGALARLWDLESGQELRQFDVPGGGFQAVFSPDGRSLLCAAAEGAVRLWDVETGKLIRLFPHKGGVAAVEFSPDGRFAVCGGYEGTVRLWHVETGEERLRMEGHKQRIRTVAYSPDGRYVLSGSGDRTARLWPLPTEVYQNAAVGVAEHSRKVETATPENGVRAVP